MASADDEPEHALSEPYLELSNIGPLVNGSGFAFRTLRCVGKRIGPIKAIDGYPHLQIVDLSENVIKDVAPLKSLLFVFQLNLSKNLIATLKGWESTEEAIFPNLIHIDLSDNQLTTLPVLPMKALRTASVARNELSTCQDFTGLEKLEKLDLSGNKLTTITAITALPALRILNVSSNELSTLAFGELPAIQDVNLASNKFKSLDASWQELQTIRTLDVSNCQLEEIESLKALRQLPLLRDLKVEGNPFVSNLDVSLPVAVLHQHWRLEALDGEVITEAQIEEAKERNIQRLLEERAAKAAADAAVPTDE